MMMMTVDITLGYWQVPTSIVDRKHATTRDCMPSEMPLFRRPTLPHAYFRSVGLDYTLACSILLSMQARLGSSRLDRAQKYPDDPWTRMQDLQTITVETR
jgi:hypothetical protein